MKKKNFIFIFLILVLFWPLLLASIKLQKSTHEQKTKDPRIQKSSPTISPTTKPERVEGQITIKFKPGVTDTQIQELLAKYNAKIIKSIPQIRWYTIEVPKDQTASILEQLSKEGLIEKAEPNFKVHLMVAPNDPQYNQQWALKNTGQTIPKSGKGKANAHVNIEQAWSVTQGNGIKVALLDSGINLSHEDLQGKIIAQKSFAPGETTVEDTFGHGTMDAGIIAASTNNGKGIAGVCPGCQLIIVKMSGASGGSTDVVAESMVYAADQGAKIVNMSFGLDSKSQVMLEGVNYMLSKGVIPVASAGNCGNEQFKINNCQTKNPLIYPAAYPGVISVANTDNKDARHSYSNFGTWITIAAPGTDILTTAPNRPYLLMQEDKTLKVNYGYVSGTSQAAPHVAGVLALILSTGATRDEAIKIVCDTADKIPGTGTNWKCGRINAAKAVAAGTKPTLQPTVPSIAPTFTAISDCQTNNTCPTNEPENSVSTNPEPEQPSEPAKGTDTQAGGKKGSAKSQTKDKGLLSLIIQLVILILELLLKRHS